MAASRLSDSLTLPRNQRRRLRRSVLLLLLVGAVWLGVVGFIPQAADADLPTAQPHTVLAPGTVVSMDSPVFAYSPGWHVSSHGADPKEPDEPWLEPSGTVTFTYEGETLDLLVAPGDYWGYLYVTVDGQPANALPAIAGNRNSRGEAAGYTTLYAPEAAADGTPDLRWQRIHQEPENRQRHTVIGQPHMVVLEVWRSWGQIPLRAVAVDAFPLPPLPLWPGITLLVFATGALVVLSGEDSIHFVAQREPASMMRLRRHLFALVRSLALPNLSGAWRVALSTVAICGIAVAIYFDSWLLCLAATGGLAYASVMRPALWPAALLFALPFYYSVTLPVLPSRDVGIVDAGVFGGIIVVFVGRLIAADALNPTQPRAARHVSFSPAVGGSLAILIGWALVTTLAAVHVDVALYEWRTVFLAAGLFGLILHSVFRHDGDPNDDLWLLIGAWLAGATTVAAVGLLQLAGGDNLITAEGVYRIRAFYGSPNNLALYLERSVMVCLGLALLAPARRAWWLAGAAIQGLALLFTFSKGSLLIGLPAGFVVLALAGGLYLHRSGASFRPLWWLVTPAALAIVVLGPFAGAERFQNLFDFTQGTAFLRLQLWRSAWQMALDHPLLGVGPDNFLYWFRSTYILPQAWQEPNLNHPHNLLLDLWTRLGIPGLAVGLAFFVAGIAGLIHRIRSASPARPDLAALNIGFLAAAAAALAHGLIDTVYALPDLMLVWVLLFGVGIRARSWRSPRLA